MKQLIGKKINNRFVLESIIGQGGMGCVYKALDLRKQEANNANPYIAIKILNQEFSSNQAAIELLEQESTKTQSLKHPNIVTVNDFDRDGDFTYITMELLEGQTLRELLNKQYKNGIPYTQAIDIISVLVDALAFAHAQGITHRDFKPENIFITNDEKIRIIDFGISRKTQNKSDGSRAVALDAISPGYSSFEMYYDFQPEPIDDVYSLACVSYEMLAGKHPFNALKAPEVKRLSITAAPINCLNKRQNKALLHALECERINRVHSVKAFYEELTCTDKQKNIISNRKLYIFIVLLIFLLLIIFYWLNSEKKRLSIVIEEPSSILIENNAINIENKTKNEEIQKENKPFKKHVDSDEYKVEDTNLEDNTGKILPDKNNSSAILEEDREEQLNTIQSGVAITPAENKQILSSEAIIFYSGSTKQEIDEALILCQAFSNDCNLSWYETEHYKKNELLPFKLDPFEISARLYAEFIKQTGYETDAEKRGFSYQWNGEELEKVYGYTWAAPQGSDSSYQLNPDFPVVNVSWQDANAYCRSKGGRLPSLEEWEYSARGVERRLYPWGNQWIPDNVNHNKTTVANVDSFPQGASPEGIHHLSGNVWEWTRSKTAQGYYLKGGSYVESNPANFRSAMSRIDNVSSSAPDDGFRCSYRIKYWPVSQ